MAYLRDKVQHLDLLNASLQQNLSQEIYPEDEVTGDGANNQVTWPKFHLRRWDVHGFGEKGI